MTTVFLQNWFANFKTWISTLKPIWKSSNARGICSHPYLKWTFLRYSSFAHHGFLLISNFARVIDIHPHELVFISTWWMSKIEKIFLNKNRQRRLSLQKKIEKTKCSVTVCRFHSELLKRNRILGKWNAWRKAKWEKQRKSWELCHKNC